jgi:hypothetical protein
MKKMMKMTIAPASAPVSGRAKSRPSVDRCATRSSWAGVGGVPTSTV